MFKALLVDDEPMAIEALRMAADWEDQGFDICGECGNGEEAYKMARELKPDIIVTDVRMPVMDGLELARLVSEDTEIDAEVMIVSGYDDFEYAKRAMEYGIKHYILKPVFKDEFSEVLLKVIPDVKRKYELKKISTVTSRVSISSWLDRYLSGELGEEVLQDSLHFEFPQNNVKWIYACLDTVRNWTDRHQNNSVNIKSNQDSLREILNKNLSNVYIYPVFAAAKLDGLVICSEGNKTAGEIISVLTANILKLWGSGFYMGVGNPVDNLYQIKDSMSQAIAAMDYRFFNPPGSTILYTDIKEAALNYSLKGIEKLEALYSALENLDEKKTIDSITLIFNEFCKEFTAPEIIKMYVVNIVYKSFSIIRSFGGSPDKIPLANEITEFLGKSPVIKEIETRLKEYCKAFCRYAISFKPDSKKSDMEIVEEYIKNNYTRNLTIREISSKLYIHPNYLGHQINKWFGCSFNEYLHTLRMEEAKRLLEDKDLKVHEIAERLGYSTYNSFLEQFVKRFSMKPSDFRVKLNKKN